MGTFAAGDSPMRQRRQDDETPNVSDGMSAITRACPPPCGVVSVGGSLAGEELTSEAEAGQALTPETRLRLRTGDADDRVTGRNRVHDPPHEARRPISGANTPAASAQMVTDDAVRDQKIAVNYGIGDGYGQE